MGSSESDNTGSGNTCSASEPTGVQESSIFGDISNLSPAPPLKDAAILQGFAGMTSPPNVFTSPHINPQPSFLNRQQQCHTSSGFSVDSVKLEEVDTTPYDPETLVSQLNIAVKSLDQNVAVEKLLDAPLDREFIDSGSREHLDDAPKALESNTVKEDNMKDNCLTSETSWILLKRADECQQGEHVAGVDQIKDENYQFYSTSEVCSDLNSKPFIDPAHDQPIYGDSLNEVNHIQTDVLRRGLQFGECRHRSIRSNLDYSTERHISIADLSQNFIPETPCNRHVAVQSESASTMRLRSCTSIAVSKPRGIGLHLNSVVASPPGGLVTGKQSSKGMVKLEGKSLIRSGIVNSCAVSSNNVEKVSSITEGDMRQSESVEMVTPNKLLLANSAKPLDSPILLSSAGEEEMAESMAVLNEPGSKTGRTQASGSTNGDGCKRCSCKKSKCLKLYCDCFAAGLYCLDSCSCKGCFNRPEFKDTVLEARQQIESRNPLAFAPRIMQHVTNSPTNSGESAESVGPSSLRHKRGCNCRKSMCLKKYCECYQANVGCSDGCRCEGCKNVYGKKPDYGMSRHIINKRTFDEILEEIPDHKRKLLITSRRHVSIDKVVDSPVAVPITPALPCSDSRKNEMKSLLPGRRYVLSPEPNLHTPPPGIHKSSSGSSLVQHGSRNPTESIPLTPSVPVGLVNLCHVTPLSSPLQTTAVAPSSNARHVQEAPPPSPVREIARSKTPEYLHASGYCGWPGDDTMDSDTPAILRDSPVPIKSVKVSSPNKKRISPPHNHLNELRPISSGEVRSSQKYIFRSVPKFPPLSPCLGSKDPSERPADTHHRSISP